jgi:predicted Abi (CAAX) family protease
MILAGGYGLAAIAVRAIAGDNDTLEAVLRLGGLTLLALAAGRWMLSASGVPRPLLAGVLGLGAPPLAGLALAGGLIALLTLGWPLTGALGASRASLGLLIQTLAVVLPEELVFRGAILGLLTYRHPRRTTLAAGVSLLIYLAFIPTQVLPSGNWDALVWLLALPPLALLATELRALTGSLWAGVVVCWFLRVMPQLFTDPRDELFCWQPWSSPWFRGRHGGS